MIPTLIFAAYLVFGRLYALLDPVQMVSFPNGLDDFPPSEPFFFIPATISSRHRAQSPRR